MVFYKLQKWFSSAVLVPICKQQICFRSCQKQNYASFSYIIIKSSKPSGGFRRGAIAPSLHDILGNAKEWMNTIKP